MIAVPAELRLWGWNQTGLSKEFTMKRFVSSAVALAFAVMPSVVLADSAQESGMQLVKAEMSVSGPVEMTDSELDKVAAGALVNVSGNQVQVQAQVGVLAIQGQQQGQKQH
jgi:hypothetical protein